MLSAEMITPFTDKTLAGARAWWDSMLEKGLYINPEDDPTEAIDDQGDRILDDAACEKLEGIYDEMYASLGGSETLDIGVAAWYKHQGYEWNAELNEYQPKAIELND